MKLGLLTAAFPDSPLIDVADWAAANGFSMLEVACWPRAESPARRYAGVSHIDVDGLGDDEAKELVADLATRGIEISGLGYYPNPLHPDPDHRAEVNGHLRKVIEAAARMGVPVVNTFIGADQQKTVQENFASFTQVWPDHVGFAADHGVKIAIENCPMIFTNDEWPGGQNLMRSPAIWRDIFGYLDGDTLGLNLDPSHLVWQMIDVERVVREFGSRIYHAHAKDMEVDPDGPAAAGSRSGRLGAVRRRALSSGVRPRVVRRARGSRLRRQRGEGEGRIPHRPRRRLALRALSPRTVPPSIRRSPPWRAQEDGPRRCPLAEGRFRQR